MEDNDKDVEVGTDVGDPSAVELTEREILLAQGEDLDDPSVDAEIEGAPVSSDPPAEEETAEETAEDEGEETSWITDADRNRAKSYGLDPEDLDAYETREQFGKVLKALDKAATRAPLKKADPTADDPDDDDGDDELADSSKPLTADGKVNVAYYEANDYDEGTIAAMKVLRKQQDFSTEVEDQRQQESYARHINEFMDAADTLRPDYYGDSTKGKLSPQYAQRRSELYDATLLVAQYIAAQQEREGKAISVPPVAELVKRAELVAFGNSLPKGKPTAAQARTQGNRVRPVGNTAGARRSAARKSTDDPAEIANDPDVMAAFERMTSSV
jgi:hypothetical protein